MTSDLTNFPICVHINAASWTDSIERECFFADGNVNGKRISFYSYGYRQTLKFEVEYYRQDTQEAVYWVKMPEVKGNYSPLDGEQNDIIVAYGGEWAASDQDNPTDVWDSNYAAVYHVGDNSWGTSPEAKDSTVNAQHLINYSTTLAEGYVRKGRTTGPGLSMRRASHTMPTGTNPRTISAWYKSSYANSDGHQIIGWGSNSYGQRCCLLMSSDGVGMEFCNGAAYINQSSDFLWHYLSVSCDGTVPGCVINFDGVYRTIATLYDLTVNTTAANLNAGVFSGYNGYWFYGIVDEMRISNIVRSPAWMKLEYYSMRKAPASGYAGDGGGINPTITWAEQVGSPSASLSPSASVSASEPFVYAMTKTFTMNTTSSGANIETDQSNFTVCVHINSSSWTSFERNCFFDAMNIGGKRINFYTQNFSHKLEFEVEYYNSSSQEAVYWVKIPTVQGSYYGTLNAIMLAYGGTWAETDQDSPRNAWDSNYVGVWHMGDNAMAAAYPNINDTFGAETQQNFITGGNGNKLHDWYILNTANAAVIDANITNAGKLTITANAVQSDCYSNNFTGPYIYKYVTGDFDVSTYISSTNADQNYELCGLLARDTEATGNEDWCSIKHGYHTNGLKLHCSNTTNGGSTETFVVVDDRYLRITRVDNVFTLYSKANVGDAWTQRAQYTRSTFKTTCQIGISFFTYNTSATFSAQFDSFEGTGSFTGALESASGLNLVDYSTTDAAGYIRRCRAFNGTNQYLYCPDTSALDLTGDITVSAWINPVAVNDYRMILDKGDWNYCFRIQSGYPQLWWENSGYTLWQMATTISTGSWLYLAAASLATPQSDTAIYENGVLKGGSWTMGDGSSPRVADNQVFHIGRQNDGSQWFSGSIDEVRLSSVCRSADWIGLEYKSIQKLNFAGDGGGSNPFIVWSAQIGSPSSSPSASVSLSPSLSESASISLSPSASESLSPSASISLSPSASESLSPSASISLSPSASESLSPSASESLSPSASESLSPSSSPSTSEPG